MDYFDEEKKTYDEEVVKQYVNIIGLDESEIKNTRLKRAKGIKLYCLSDLYELLDADKTLLASSKDVGSSYELLDAQLNEDFLYESEFEKERAKEDAFAILNEVSCIQVAGDSDDPYVIFERTNELLSTILSGLVCAESIPKLRFMTRNLSTESLIRTGMKNEDNPLPLRKLYGLIALSRFENSSVDENIFDQSDKIDEKRLLKVLNELMDTEIDKLKDDQEEHIALPKEKKLLFNRPSFKNLKELGDYRRM